MKKFSHSDEDEFRYQYDGKNQTLLFIYCMFKNVNNNLITDVAEKCANDNFIGDIWINDILMCAEGEEGNEIMREMGGKTLNLRDPLEHSPWIVINGQRSAIAQSDLQTMICNNLLVTHCFLFALSLFILLFIFNLLKTQL